MLRLGLLSLLFSGALILRRLSVLCKIARTEIAGKNTELVVPFGYLERAYLVCVLTTMLKGTIQEEIVLKVRSVKTNTSQKRLIRERSSRQ